LTSVPETILETQREYDLNDKDDDAWEDE